MCIRDRLSMGGHGGMWLSIRHQDIFGGGGSMSGGLDIRPFPDSWNMKARLGEYASNKEVWDNHTVINQLDRLKDGSLAIIIDCGADDFFLQVNKAAHEALLKRGIGHDFIIRPGAHNPRYWNNAIDYQVCLLYTSFGLLIDNADGGQVTHFLHDFGIRHKECIFTHYLHFQCFFLSKDVYKRQVLLL